MMAASLLDPSPVNLASWLACLFFLVAGWNQVEKFLDRRSNKAKGVQLNNDPLRVQMAVEFVRKEECEGRHSQSTLAIASVQSQLAELRAQRITDAKDSGASREKMYRKMEEFRSELSRHVEDVRKELSDKIDDMPAQIITTLKNTGAI